MLALSKKFLDHLKCRKGLKSDESPEGLFPSSVLEGIPSNSLQIPRMSYADIKHVTDNFTELIYCEDGFWNIYKGTLDNGVEVAVKRYDDGGQFQRLKEFKNELLVFSEIKHPCILSLIGYCYENSQMILVYEYMEKGILTAHLYVSDGDASSAPLSRLSWEQRLQICIDSAEGLLYLHSGSTRRIVHRDLKSRSILLGKNYIAKVSDLGLSKEGGLYEEHYTTQVMGTYGYLDPQYVRTGHLTEKSDVYSFGVVLLEVLCARPPIMGYAEQEEERSLAKWCRHLQEKGELERIIDPVLAGSVVSSSFRLFSRTAMKCLSANMVERPTMREVLWNLEFALELQQRETHREQNESRVITPPASERRVWRLFTSCLLDDVQASDSSSVLNICSGIGFSSLVKPRACVGAAT